MVHPLDYERIAVPPHGKPVMRCQYFPECQCGDDCTDRSDARMMGILFILFIVGIVAIGAGLIFFGLRS